MQWVYIEDLGRHIGEEVTLKGWLYNRRSSGKIHFLLIRDGTGICQCVASLADIGAEAFAEADHLGQESSIEVTGLVRDDKRAPGGRELTINRIVVMPPRRIIRLHPKNTAWHSYSTCATYGSVRRGSTQSCECAARLRPLAVSFFMSADLCCLTHRY